MAKTILIRTAFNTIKAFNAAHESNLKENIKFNMPELPTQLKKKNDCFIYSFAHLLYYIKRFISFKNDIEYSVVLALKLLSNAMFPSIVISPDKQFKIKSFGSSLKNIKYAHSNRGKYITAMGKSLPIEITGKEKTAYQCITLAAYTTKNKTHPPYVMMKITENDAKLVAIHDVISDYHRIQNESMS